MTILLINTNPNDFLGDIWQKPAEFVKKLAKKRIFLGKTPRISILHQYFRVKVVYIISRRDYTIEKYKIEWSFGEYCTQNEGFAHCSKYHVRNVRAPHGDGDHISEL